MKKLLIAAAFASGTAFLPLMADDPRDHGKILYPFEVHAMESAIQSIKCRIDFLNKDSKEFKNQIELINYELDFLEFCLTSAKH